MATVMPCVDDFLPVHNLVSLDHLAGVLSSVAAIRPVRRQRVLPPELEAAEGRSSGSTAQPSPKEDPDWAERVRKRLDAASSPTIQG
jgi:hypothetical protein